MIDWNAVLVQQERHKDLLREAEGHRLVRQALRGCEKHDRFHRRALIWLGHRLVAWGALLQERYGITVETPALHCREVTINRCF